MGGDGRNRQAYSNGALLELHRGMRGGEPTGLRRCGAESAIERLRQAETRINDAETARARAEDSLVRLTARLQEAENKVAGAERQMRSAEVRAMQAEKAVIKVLSGVFPYPPVHLGCALDHLPLTNRQRTVTGEFRSCQTVVSDCDVVLASGLSVNAERSYHRTGSEFVRQKGDQ
jgi:hypothetical protein